MELACNSLFTGDGSWVFGKVDMEVTKTFKNYDIMHRSALFFSKICVFLGHIFKKFRADHTGFFSYLIEGCLKCMKQLLKICHTFALHHYAALGNMDNCFFSVFTS